MTVLERVQLNPEITTDDASFVADLVARAQGLVVAYCSLPRFPELAKGYSMGAASASEDITALDASESIGLSVNGSPIYYVSVATAGLTSGALIAAALQTAIRGFGTDYGFDEVTVTFAAGVYTITSGRYGETSAVYIICDTTSLALPRALKLSPEYGGTELPGSAVDADLESAAVEICEQLYRKLGVEGLASYSMHQGEFNGMAYSRLDPATLARLRAKRRLW